MTIRQLIERYRHASGERAREDGGHAAWWCAQIGREPVSALTTGCIIQTLETRLAAYGRSPSTVAFYFRFLRRVCAWGARTGALPIDPCAGIALPKERTPLMRWLTDEEEGRLCAALGLPYALWVKLAIETGLKQSEQFTLRWRDVDLDRATVLLPHPQSGALSVLTVEPVAVEILQQLRQQHPPSLWVFPDPHNPFRAVNIHAFCTGRWKLAVQRSGIPWCAWKDLRHTRGVRLAKQGIPVNDILRVMRLRETRQAYTYRAYAAGRGGQPKPKACPRRPVFDEMQDGELRAAILRDAERAPLTFKEGARLYAVHHLQAKPTRIQFDRIYRQFWQPWADRLLTSLTRKEILAWYLGLDHIPSHANKALTLLRSLYNWALAMELIPYSTGNPGVRIRRFATTSRERVLTLEELRRMLEGLSYVPVKARAYLLVLLLTGGRRSEALMMQWADIDEAGLWTKRRTKNGTSQLVSIPRQALEALRALPQSSRWVFPGRHDQPWSVGSVEKTWSVIRRRWGLDDVRLHDLRRTCGSYLARRRENEPTIKSVLNHRSQTPTSIYTRIDIETVARALQKQADWMFSLLQPNMMSKEPTTQSPTMPRLIHLESEEASYEENALVASVMRNGRANRTVSPSRHRCALGVQLTMFCTLRGGVLC